MKNVCIGIALLIVLFDIVTFRGMLKGTTETGQGVVMLAGSLVILCLLYLKGRKITSGR